jgi:large subunit ribosomal protein L13
LKIETFKQLQARIPSRIIEEAVWGMLPKGVLGRNYYRRLFVYSDNKINYAKQKTENVFLFQWRPWSKITGLL